MTRSELSDLVLGRLQDDIAESIKKPWAEVVSERGGVVSYRICFQVQRFPDLLVITDLSNGQKFVVAIMELPANNDDLLK